MNDPGLDGPIANEAKDVEMQGRADNDQKIEDEQEFLEPSRYWFLSTAFPLIAGTFGPMASAFSICALVVHWRVWIPPDGGTEEHGIFVTDPRWLIGINAAQLAIALISNLFLLLNMARRVRFSVAQPITIIGWYLSSFTLVGLTATASGPLRLQSPPDHAFTQAFYYACFSAGLYFLVASLMVANVFGTYKGYYDNEFKLTMSQRSLMLQTISFLVYLELGALVFSHIEDWNYLDAVYWADFTLLTVGIGDYSPMTHLGRGLLFPFAIGGIIILGLVIGSIRSLVLERGKAKMGARMVEKQREAMLKKLNKKRKDLLNPVDDKTLSPSSTKTMTEDEYLTERKRREEEFQIMRKIQGLAESRRRWTSLIISGSVWFILWFAGAAIFQQTERNQSWTYFESLYFAYTSLLTIGYGDLYPMSNSGKPFFVFWSLLAIPSLTILISNMGDTIVKGIRDLTLWVGNFTVLPGENGIKNSLKESAYKVTRGKMFDDQIEETPMGILGMARKRKDEGEEEEDHPPKNDPESAAAKASGQRAGREGERARKLGEDDDKAAVPKSKRHYHLLLIKEISQVMKHLNDNPPRKYTFDEWAWYLKLVGEDESSPETHRRPLRKPKADGEGLATAMTTDGDDSVAKWSWVGNRSPLMGDKEEPEWVLERLINKLEKELEVIREEEELGNSEKHDGNTKGLRKESSRTATKKDEKST